jgi:hypothetical protein
VTTTSACIRGCSIYRRHLSECEDQEACPGCLPRRAEYGQLCWPCHRRFHLLLHDAATVDRWLTGNMPAGEGAARAKEDYERTGGSDGSPAPLKVQIYDQRQILRDFYAALVDELVERAGLHGPGHHDAETDSRYLTSFLDRIEQWDVIGDYLEYLAEETSIAHALAPWRPVLKRVSGIPCPECEEVNLVIYGGESDVSCHSCGTMIPEKSFGLWEQIVRGEVA